jgi:uncharacterized protein (TIGR03067 family)
MKTPCTKWLALFAPIGLLMAADVRNGGQSSPLAKLDGEWIIKSIERDPPEQGKDEGKGLRCLVSDGKVTVFVPNEDKPAGRLTIEVDSTKKPMVMTIKPDGEQQSLPAVFEQQGDKLKICWAPLEKQQAPTEFSAKPGSRQTVVTLERKSQ